MRFNLLDEYSTLVPFGLGVSKQNRVVHYSDVEVNGMDVDIKGHCEPNPEKPRRGLRAFCQMVWSSYQGLIARYSWLS